MRILVLFYSRYGSVARMADLVAQGVQGVEGMEAVLRTVPPVSVVVQEAKPPVPADGLPYVTLDDLAQCDGLALGSPTRFGNMAAPLKHFIDSSSAIWMSGALQGKPAGVFTSTSSLHGGQESTLLGMMMPLFHHGMVLVGATGASLKRTRTGGTPYGPSHFAGPNSDLPISEDEKQICIEFGERLARFARALGK